MNSAELPEVFHPPINRGMKELDRSFFRKTIPTSAATILNPKDTTKIRGALTLSHDLLQVTGIRPIIDDTTEPGKKCIVLQPTIKADQPATWSPRIQQLVEEQLIQVKPFDLVLTYENWTMYNILDAILPDLPEDQKETPGGFAQAGHVAHVNLRNQYLPYKHLIGQVLLDKNPTIRTVINKTLEVGTESEFRTFPYEILAGDNDLDVTVSEADCEFRFNFAEVYWNTRLGTEHERIVAKFKPGEAVCDAMAGVGPFAVPAGKKNVFVRANDLNPQSYAGLQWAIQRNKVHGFVEASCMDARQFIREATVSILARPRTFEKMPNIKIPRNASPAKMEEVAANRLRQKKVYHEPRFFDHYVMNLPASAVEFLDAFTGIYQDCETDFEPHTLRKLPMIHIYTFQATKDSSEEEVKEVSEKVSRYLGADIRLGDGDAEIFDVRLVAPKKRYYCASFRLPPEVAFASHTSYLERSMTKPSKSKSRSQSRSRPGEQSRSIETV